MSQVAFLIIFLFTLGKRKSVATFGASDLDVWHVAVLPRVPEPLTFRALLFETWGEPSCFVLLGLRQDEDAIKLQCRLRSPKFQNGQVWLSLLQQEEWFNKIGGWRCVSRLGSGGELSAKGAECIKPALR